MLMENPPFGGFFISASLPIFEHVLLVCHTLDEEHTLFEILVGLVELLSKFD